MARKHLQSLFNQFQVSSPKHNIAGFTLIELLIAMAIGSIAISLLLAIVAQLLQTDRQESIRSETQSEMQMALDFIRNDMREAIYIYDGSCIQGRADDPATLVNEYCPGIVNHISIPSNSVPVLAFWKLEPLASKCQDTLNQTNDPCLPFRMIGRTNSLIVYFLRRNQSNENWQGQARITRYKLDQFKKDSSGNIILMDDTDGYVNPTAAGTSYRTWPHRQVNGTWTNLQTQRPQTSPSNPDTLVDFVDAGGGDAAPTCPPQYVVSPSSTTLGASFAGVRSFYACLRDVTTGTQNQQSGLNQDALVVLRGNVSGRQGNRDDSFLPTLRTQVLGRGVVGKQPQAPQ